MGTVYVPASSSETQHWLYSGFNKHTSCLIFSVLQTRDFRKPCIPKSCASHSGSVTSLATISGRDKIDGGGGLQVHCFVVKIIDPLCNLTRPSKSFGVTGADTIYAFLRDVHDPTHREPNQSPELLRLPALTTRIWACQLDAAQYKREKCTKVLQQTPYRQCMKDTALARRTNPAWGYATSIYISRVPVNAHYHDFARFAITMPQ